MTIGNDQLHRTDPDRRRPILLIAFLVLVLLVAAASGAAWHWRFSLAELAIKDAAEAAGIELLGLSVDSLDFSGAEVSDIRLGPSGSQRIDRARISWSISELVDRRVRTIAIFGARLQVVAQRDGGFAIEGLPRPEGTRRATGKLVFPKGLPFERIEIEQSQISLTLPDGTADVTVEAGLEVSAATISGEISARYSANTQRGQGRGTGRVSFTWAEPSAPQGTFDLQFERLVTADATGTNIRLSGQTDGLPDRLEDLAIRATAFAETIETPGFAAHGVDVTAELAGGMLAARGTGEIFDWTAELSTRLQPFDLSQPAEFILNARGNAATVPEWAAGLSAVGDVTIRVDAEVANPLELFAARDAIVQNPPVVADHVVARLNLVADLQRLAVADYLDTGAVAAAISGHWSKGVLDADIADPLRMEAVNLAPKLRERLAAWIPKALPFDIALTAGMGSPATVQISWADERIDVRALGGVDVVLPDGKIELEADGNATVALSGGVENFDVAALRAAFAAVPTRYGTATGDILVTDLAGADDRVAGVIGGEVSISAASARAASARQLSIKIDSEFDTTADQARVALSPGGWIEAFDVRLPGQNELTGRTRLALADGDHRVALDRQSGDLSVDVRLRSGDVRLRQAARALDIAHGPVAVTGSWPGRLFVDANGLSAILDNQRNIELARLRLRAVGQYSDAAVAITMNGAKTTVPGWTLPSFDVVGRITRRGPSLDGELEIVAAGGQPSLRVRGQHSLETGQGNGEILEARLRFAPGVLQPGDFNPAISKTIDNVFAAISLQGPITWNENGALAPNLELKIDNLAATTANFELFDAGATIQLIGAPAFETPPGQRFTGRVRVGRLDPVPLDISFQLLPGQADTGPRVIIEELTALLAEGRLKTDPFTLLPPSIDTDITLRVEGADLARAIAALDGAGIGGTGRVSGEIPMTVRGNQISIAGGRLANDGPGEIFYDIAAVPQTLIDRDDTVSLVLRELSNFSYDTLQVEMDKALDGPGSLRVHLAGANPDVLDSHPFIFNITLESNFDRLAALVLEGLTTSQGLLRALALSAGSGSVAVP
jgi:hypothetical protein